MYPRRPIAYIRAPSSSLAVCERFGADVLGLEKVAGDAEFVAFRSDERAQSIVFSATDAEPALGLEVVDVAALVTITSRLSAMGVQAIELDPGACARRRVDAGLVVRDHTGNRIELVAGAAVSARRFRSPWDSGVDGLLSVGMRSRAIRDDVRFWVETLGATVSDQVGDITYLRLDEAHHRVALYPSGSSGLLYVGLGVRTHDHLMQNHYLLQERQVRIVHGPGRETASDRMFVRFLGPDGGLFAFEHDGAEDRAGHRPRRFELSAEALCAWGSRCHDVRELAA